MTFEESSAEIARLERRLKVAKEEIEDAKRWHDHIEDELSAAWATRERLCPGHVDNGGFMYGHCKLCGAEL